MSQYFNLHVLRLRVIRPFMGLTPYRAIHADLSLTPVTYFCMLQGIHSYVDFLFSSCLLPLCPGSQFHLSSLG
ncbi:hypothetical protein DKG79_11780 [Escherichia fergusonii]|nr:hypothetical protein DKG79_11780 [Escherichia fergusonii]